MDCIICTDEITNQYVIKKSCKCKYPIHETCYAEWKKINPNKSCLICRTALNVTRQNNRHVLPQTRQVQQQRQEQSRQRPVPSAPPAESVITTEPPIPSALPADTVINIVQTTQPITPIIPTTSIQTINNNQSNPNYHWRSSNPYEILAVSNNATNDEIHQSFMFLMNVYKPSNFSNEDLENLRICEEAISAIYRAYISLIGRNYRSMQATITYPDGLSGIMAEINRYEARQNRFCNPKRKRLIMMISFTTTILGIILMGILMKVL